MDLLPQKLRVNPGKSSLYNLAAVTTNGDWQVTFRLKRPALACLQCSPQHLDRYTFAEPES